MATFYAVIHFLPSTLAEEFVNVGVVCFGHGRVLWRFRRTWPAWVNPSALELFHVHALEESALQGRFDEAAVQDMIWQWSNAIQFSRPRASLMDLDELLTTVSKEFLEVDVS